MRDLLYNGLINAANTPAAKKAHIVEQLGSLDRLLSSDLSGDDISQEIKRLTSERNLRNKRTSNSLAPLITSDSNNLQKLQVIIVRQAENLTANVAMTDLLKDEYNVFSAYQSETVGDCVKKVTIGSLIALKSSIWN